MPVVIEAVPPLVTLALLMLSLAFAVAARHLVQGTLGFLGGVISHIPLIGSAASSFTHDLEKALVGPIVRAEAFIDSQMGTCWHKLARLVQWQVHELEQLAETVAALAAHVVVGLTGEAKREITALVSRFVHRLVHTAGNVLHETVIHSKVIYHTVTREVVPTVGHLSKSVAVALPRELDRLRSRERALAHEVDVVIPRDLARLREQARADAEHGLSLFRWLRHHATAAASLAFAGAVAIAIRRLGLSWIRCNNWRRIGREVCATPLGDIEGILGLLAAGAVVADLRELVKIAQGVERATAETIQQITGA